MFSACCTLENPTLFNVENVVSNVEMKATRKFIEWAVNISKNSK